MAVRISIEIDDEMAEALDMGVEFPRELAVSAALRDWLISAGYLPDHDLEEDTPTEGEA